MEKYWDQFAISVVISLIGCLAHTVYVAVKKGFENVQERDAVVVFAEVLGCCAAIKIIYLSFDPSLCRPESRIDLAFLSLGGYMMLLVSCKNLQAKFKEVK
ncbi:hypothetical protein GCM10010967_44180 [Dyadobacter beijingensis]|uniref:Uncharacterized protein n=1 Tax=Dyadobacter beijingensis TaxID=365489 RepID=A0ABQ2IBY8_9BACT|nr:hypothetical protein [Dyadobacter beijingensis]GGN04394.1 hypothetical protein GCM10010967_44180 [Dyadobacter beijingensis]